MQFNLRVEDKRVDIDKEKKKHMKKNAQIKWQSIKLMS